MTKRLDKDIKALRMAYRAMCAHDSYHMRRATLEFLWSRLNDPTAKWEWPKRESDE